MVSPPSPAYPAAPDLRTRAAYGAWPPTVAWPPGQSNELGKCRAGAHPIVRRCPGLIGVPSFYRPEAHSARERVRPGTAALNYQRIGRASTNFRMVAASRPPDSMFGVGDPAEREYAHSMICGNWAPAGAAGLVRPDQRVGDHAIAVALREIALEPVRPRAGRLQDHVVDGMDGRVLGAWQVAMA